MNGSTWHRLRLAIGIAMVVASGCSNPEGFHRTADGGGLPTGSGGRGTFGSGGSGSGTFGTGGSGTFGSGGAPVGSGGATSGSGGRGTFGSGGSGGRGTFGSGGRGSGGVAAGSGGAGGSGGVAGGSGGATPCPTCMLSVTYAPTGTADAQAIAGEVHISTDRAVAISQISVKYWYTNETGSTSIVTDIDYVGLSTGVGLTKPTAAGTPTMAVTPPTANANTVTTISIPESSTLNPGTSLYIKFRIHDAGYQGIFMMANDYSFGAAQLLTMPWPRITAYVDGTKAWGDEP